MDDLIRKLSEIRSEYNCFDEGEESYYCALSEAIRFLSRRADGDTISRQAAIDAVEESRRLNHHKDGKAARAHEYEHIHFLKLLTYLPPEQPSRIEQALHGKAPEEQYKILYWLMFEYANTFNDARRAVIDWLGEQDENGRKDIPLDTDDVFDAELAKRILNNK